jgi:outer membrane biosynthesis protein TonB
MSADVHSAFAPSTADVRAANRLISWSIAVHVVLVIVIGLTSRFWSSTTESRRVMTISLGGSPGIRSTGTNSLGGRTVEQVAPPPRRPEPIRPTPPEPPAPVQTRTTARPAPTRPETRALPQTRAISARPPVTGTQVSEGSTTVETGARSTASGLSFGGGGTGGAVNFDTFCCPDYLRSVLQTIDSHWRKNWPERGVTTLRFIIRRDGSIDLPNVVVEKSSGSGVLDRAAISALTSASPRLLRLPSQYTEPTLIVHLTFPYGQ